MSQQIIFIPTLNDEKADFANLFQIWEQANDLSADIRFDFSACRFLRPNAVAFLGGLARQIEANFGRATFDWETIKCPGIMAILAQNGFAGTFKHPSAAWDGHAIPYREDRSLDMNGIMDYLTDSWIGKGWLQVSNRLRDAIAGRMWEVYNNAFEHSDTKIGVYSCGQHYRSSNELILTTVDFGLGIPATVRAFFRRMQIGEEKVLQLSDVTCLKWAFARGTTTCPQGVPRGLGLDLLKEFIRVNQGKMEIYSGDGYVIVDDSGERFEPIGQSFSGTIAHISLRCDEHLYRFSDEQYNG